MPQLSLGIVGRGMLTLTVRAPRVRRLLGVILLAGLAGALALATVGLLRGARSMHGRPMSDGIGADAVGSGIATEHTAFHARLDESGHP